MRLDLSKVTDLAPLVLVNHRSMRYSGDTICSSMEDFVSSDQEIIQTVYNFLMALFKKLAPPLEDPVPVGPLKVILREFQFYHLVDQVRMLGCVTHAKQASERVAKTIHDLRGGALTSLVGHLDALIDMADEAETPGLFFPLVRDHLKIMRNSLHDLDYEKRQRDLLPRAHSIDLIIEKWQQATFHFGDKQIKVQLECHYPHGTISECCVESAALDRIMYNLMNNAARHAAEPVIDFVLVPIPNVSNAESLRFVVANAMAAEDVEKMQPYTGEDGSLGPLFRSGTSTTGSGLGLSIAAEFVANAYGLHSQDDAVEGGYIGARMSEDQFVAWFHWPLSSWISIPMVEEIAQKAELS